MNYTVLQIEVKKEVLKTKLGLDNKTEEERKLILRRVSKLSGRVEDAATLNTDSFPAGMYYIQLIQNGKITD